MKILIACDAPNSDSNISIRFGRSQWFALYTPGYDIEFIQNPFMEIEDGVAEKLSFWLVRLDVKKVIAGEFGEKMDVRLREVNIQMIIVGKDKNISNLIELLKQTYK